MKRAVLSVVVFLVLGALGCTSVKVSKVDFDPASGTEATKVEGIRYSLPKPVLKVVPQADGTIEVEVIYLPDRSQTYAISAQSRAAKHKLQVDVANGLLKKVVWGPDTSGVPKQALDSAAAIEKALLDAQKADLDAAQAKAEAEIKAKETALATALAVLEAAELELALKQAELGFLLQEPSSADTDAKVAAVRLAIVVAEAKVTKAREKVAQAQAALEEEIEGSFDLLAGNTVSQGADKAPGALFYAILETAGTAASNGSPAIKPSLELKAMQMDGSFQKEFDTTTIAKPVPVAEVKLATHDGLRPQLPLTETPGFELAVKAVRLAKKRLKALQASGSPVAEIRKAKVAVALAEEELEIQKERAYRIELTASRPLYKLGDLIDPTEPKCEFTLKPVDVHIQCALRSSSSVIAEVSEVTPGVPPEGTYRLKLNFVYFVGKDRTPTPGSREIEFDAVKPPSPPW